MGLGWMENVLDRWKGEGGFHALKGFDSFDHSSKGRRSTSSMVGIRMDCLAVVEMG